MKWFRKLFGEKGDPDEGSASDTGTIAPQAPKFTPQNEAAVVFNYISARYRGLKLPNLGALRPQVRAWVLSLDIDELETVYKTVKFKSVPMRKILSGAYLMDGKRGNGHAPWVKPARAPNRIQHNGRVYVLDDGNRPSIASDDDMIVDRLADLLLERMASKLAEPAPRSARYVH